MKVYNCPEPCLEFELTCKLNWYGKLYIIIEQSFEVCVFKYLSFEKCFLIIHTTNLNWTLCIVEWFWFIHHKIILSTELFNCMASMEIKCSLST